MAYYMADVNPPEEVPDQLSEAEMLEGSRNMKELEIIARSINPDLPTNLSGYLVTISMSVGGVFAIAIPLEDTEAESEQPAFV